RENSEMSPQLYGKLIFDKAGKNIQWEKSLQQMVLGKLDSNMQKNKTGPFLTQYTIVSLKWMKDLNVRQGIIKSIEKNIGSNIFDLGLSNFLLTRLQRQEKQKQ
ncbi:LORF2 protein, partial [Crocuta crocuta]